MTKRQELVTEARSWLGTRFRHQGRVKKTSQHVGGCDCIGLVVGVVRDLKVKSVVESKLLHEHDHMGYSHMPDGKLLQDSLAEHLEEIPVKDIQPGDVLLFRFEKDPQHVGIVTDYTHGGLGIIHCYAGSRKVVEHSLDNTWYKRIVTSFRFYHLED